MTNIILCGGSGTRLWPISRTLMPKQFVKLFDDKSLFQLTVERNSKVCDSQFVVSNAEQYFLALDQLEELTINHQPPTTNYLLEPVGRNTAPAIALACMALDPKEIVLVTPSDHLVKNETAYESTLNKAKEFAKDDFLVTFGIKPTFPETGFGYIEANQYDVVRFHEKPDVQTAKEYLQQNTIDDQPSTNRYFWNSGMFMFKAGVFLKELENHSPKIYEASLKAYENASRNDNLIRIKLEDMLIIEEDSIYYAVMEKSTKVKVVPSDIDWSDVGSFDALYEELPKDENGNTKNSKHIAIDEQNWGQVLRINLSLKTL